MTNRSPRLYQEKSLAASGIGRFTTIPTHEPSATKLAGDAPAPAADVKLSIGTTVGAAVTPTSSWTTVFMTATNTGVWGGGGNFASVGLASAEVVATTVNTIDIEICLGERGGLICRCQMKSFDACIIKTKRNSRAP